MLPDKSMVERGGFLVPRVGRSTSADGSGAAIRVDAAGVQEARSDARGVARSPADDRLRGRSGVGGASRRRGAGRAEGCARASGSSVPPRASPPRRRARAPGGSTSVEAYEVVERLTERARRRPVRSPWAPRRARGVRGVTGARCRPRGQAWRAIARTLVYDVRARHERRWRSSCRSLSAGGKVWLPDARKWNMSEGSFDEREAIFAPAPSTFRFSVTVPLFARLSFSPALASGQSALFAVHAVDAGGASHELYSRRWGPATPSNGSRRDRGSGARTVASASTSSSRPRTRRRRGGRATGSRCGATRSILARRRRASRTTCSGSSSTRSAPTSSRASTTTPRTPRSAPRRTHRSRRCLPKVPGPHAAIDALAARGVRFTARVLRRRRGRARERSRCSRASARASSASTPSLAARRTATVRASTRPSRRSCRSSCAGRGVVTRAFVNNFFMGGYVAVGARHGLRARRPTTVTARATRPRSRRDAVAWLNAHKDERFFVFCNYNSPHEPYDPPDRLLARVPHAARRARATRRSRKYMAEGAKDDEAVGVLLQTLDELGLRDRTIVVVTADHGETLSSAHDGHAALDHMPVRFHHAVGQLRGDDAHPDRDGAPGHARRRRASVTARVRNVDIAPTILELEGLEPDAEDERHGRSCRSRAGEPEADERVVVSEGRGTRGLLVGNDRLHRARGRRPVDHVRRQGGPRHRGALRPRRRPGRAATTSRTPSPTRSPRCGRASPRRSPTCPSRGRAAAHAAAPRRPRAVTRSPALRRARARRTGSRDDHVGDGRTARPSCKARRVPPMAAPAGRTRPWTAARLRLTTAADALVGLDLGSTPASAPFAWELFLDDAPVARRATSRGPFGLAAPRLVEGIATRRGARRGVLAGAAGGRLRARPRPLRHARRARGRRPRRARRPGRGRREMHRLLRSGATRTAAGKQWPLSVRPTRDARKGARPALRRV